MKLKLIRIEKSSEGVFGVLLIEGRAFCITLEPEDKDNKKNKSCIPKGDYICAKKTSRKYGKTFEVIDVFRRSNILFHSGNIEDHTKGCILLGQYFGKLRGKRAILNSGKTFKDFMRVMNKSDCFNLKIVTFNSECT